MKFLSAADTEAAFDWPNAIECMRNAYATSPAPKAVPGRLVAADQSAWLRCMPAIPGSGSYMGAKQISRTRNGKVAYVITLFNKISGQLDYLIDGISITAMRTAATSAVALDALSGAGPIAKLAVIGAGLEARSHANAIATAREVRALSVYSPTSGNREKFASEFRALGIDAHAAASAEEAVRGASHVVTAARSRDESPILFANWLEPGTVVVSIGSTTPSQREVDVSVVERASVIVSDEPKELEHDTGDMIAATDAGATFQHKLFSLYDLVQGKVPARPASDIVMFKSVGSALQDVSFAEHVADVATRKKLGLALAVDFKIKHSIGKNT
jgi:ornithine cyclodeaminase/alanine dehydrogenase-like protein (mu-crystallin family)